jgi:hypothetical protein
MASWAAGDGATVDSFDDATHVTPSKPDAREYLGNALISGRGVGLGE